jgi:hypothetical protein
MHIGYLAFGRLGAFAAALLLGRGITLNAQQDSLRQAAATPGLPSLPSDTVTGPRTVHDAEAAGIKMLGLYDVGDGHWIAGATIRDTLGNEAVTSRIGIAALNALTPIAGYYLLEIRKPGYSPRWIRLRDDTTSEILTALAPNPLGGTLLAPTVVTAEKKLAYDDGQRAGFIYRCQTGLISCVGRAVLDKHTTGNLDTFLDHVDGINRMCMAKTIAQLNPQPGKQPLGPAPAAGSCPIRMDGGCIPNYVVNGFDWAPLGEDAQAELDQYLNSATIDGMEVYLPDHPVPKRFDPKPFSGCGVIVIWMR